MPVCFQLFRKAPGGSSDDPAVSLVSVDEEICAYLQEEVHPTRWCAGWYDLVGSDLAHGESWDQIQARYEGTEYAFDPRLPRIVAWLREHFEVRSWWEPSSRG